MIYTVHVVLDQTEKVDICISTRHAQGKGIAYKFIWIKLYQHFDLSIQMSGCPPC